MRINKYIASSGVCSRRQAEKLVLDGKVEVNGEVLTDLAFDVSGNDYVEVDGIEIMPVTNYIYLAMHKPKACVCTNSDEHGRRTENHLLPPKYNGVKLLCVGRLN